jgi:hypothetical protein
MASAHLDRAMEVLEPLQVVVLTAPFLAQGGDDRLLFGEVGRQGGGGGEDGRMAGGGGDGAASGAGRTAGFSWLPGLVGTV